SDLPGLALLLRERQRLLQVAACRGQVSLPEMGVAERLQHRGDAPVIAHLAGERQALRQIALRFGVAAHEEAELSGVGQAPAPQIGADPGGVLERFYREPMTEAEEPTVQPIGAHQVRELEAGFSAPREALATRVRREQVLEFRIEACQPLALLRAG